MLYTLFMNIKLGMYRHFKGGLYEVIGIAKHSETLEEFVVYKHADNGSIWLRPTKMFLENVTRNGKTIPRFKKIEK